MSTTLFNATNGTDNTTPIANGTNWSYVVSTVTLTTTMQKFTYTATLPANTTQVAIAVSYVPTGTAGANDWYQITGLQLEKGSTATSFDYRPYGTELALCQRYYTRITPFVAGGQLGIGVSTSTTAAWIQLTPAPVALRSSPTINYSSVIVSDNVNYNLAVSSITISAQTLTGGGIGVVNATGATQFRPAILNATTLSSYIDYSAEL